MCRDWIPSYTEDTTDFLLQLQIPHNAISITMDVASLYTDIPHNEGINSVANILKLSDRDEDFIDEIKVCIYLFSKTIFSLITSKITFKFQIQQWELQWPQNMLIYLYG